MLSPLIEGGYVFGGGDRYSLGCALQLPSIVAAELQRKGAFTPQAIAEAERLRAHRIPGDAGRTGAERRGGHGLLRPRRRR